MDRKLRMELKIVIVLLFTSFLAACGGQPAQQEFIEPTVEKIPPTPAISAYRDLLEQDTCEWSSWNYDPSDFQFALIHSGNETDTTYLLLQNLRASGAEGFHHLLVYQEGEIKTLWGDGQNCIYIRGFAKDKETGGRFYLIASGGRQGITNYYVYQLNQDKIDLSAEKIEIERLDTTDPDGKTYITEHYFYWRGEEVEEAEYLAMYNELLDGEIMEFSWLDNTEENRDLIFGNESKIDLKIE